MSVYKGYAYDNLAINNPQLHNPQLHNPTLTGTMTNLLTANALPQVITVTDATYTATAADHGKVIMLSRASGVTVTLPTPTGSLAQYRFMSNVQLTSNSHIIKVANAAHYIGGVIGSYDAIDNTPAITWYSAAAGDDTITLAHASTGGMHGYTDIVLTDVAANRFLAFGITAGFVMTIATPFSATVS